MFKTEKYIKRNVKYIKVQLLKFNDKYEAKIIFSKFDIIKQDMNYGYFSIINY